ncbi:MAG: hypothetical protein M5U34_04430 [Chloroflexi bacterium]|nr:hypothetical protein [Chloroflexota bacterium]
MIQGTRPLPDEWQIVQWIDDFLPLFIAAFMDGHWVALTKRVDFYLERI